MSTDQLLLHTDFRLSDLNAGLLSVYLHTFHTGTISTLILPTWLWVAQVDTGEARRSFAADNVATSRGRNCTLLRPLASKEHMGAKNGQNIVHSHEFQRRRRGRVPSPQG